MGGRGGPVWPPIRIALRRALLFGKKFRVREKEKRSINTGLRGLAAGLVVGVVSGRLVGWASKWKDYWVVCGRCSGGFGGRGLIGQFSSLLLKRKDYWLVCGRFTGGFGGRGVSWAGLCQAALFS